MKTAGDKPTIFFSPLKGQSASFVLFTAWAPATRGQHGLESQEESLEWEALWRDLGEWLWDFQGKDIPGQGYTAAIFLEKS